MVVRPILLYGTEYLSIKKTQVYRLMANKMRMIYYIYGYMQLDRIMNKVIKDKVGKIPMEDNMRCA